MRTYNYLYPWQHLSSRIPVVAAKQMKL